MNLLRECLLGNLENVKYLVEQGADISVSNYISLRYAVRMGHLEVVKFLVEQGSDISVNNHYPLRTAVFVGHLEIVNYFRKVLSDKIPCHECLVRSACLELCF